MENKAEQYYPTYNFNEKSRDVVLLEFQESLKIANNQTKVYAQVTNIILAVITILIPFFLNQVSYINEKTFNLIKNKPLIFAIILVIFGALLLRFFVELQRQIIFNSRKAITLRTMLGLDYGSINLTLPNWRIEGATSPFAIKFFNGWFVFQSMPFWILIIGINCIWWISTYDFNNLLFYLGNVFISLWYLYIYRTNLNAPHETNYLNIVRFISKCFRFKLLDDFEYIIYRAKLQVIEVTRMNVNYENIKEIVKIIEDETFDTNIGVSIKSIFRGLLSQFKYFRNKCNILKSGGSTITMQLSRTLFIPPQNKYKRKILEILISFWFNLNFSKKEILNLYIVSVRYFPEKMGLLNAMKIYFGENKNKTLSIEESFFLVERLSNLRKEYDRERISNLLKKLKRNNISIDLEVLKNLYLNSILKEKVKK